MLVGGREFSLTRDDVEDRLQGVAPERIQKHFVEVNGELFPPKQVLGEVTGWERTSFTTAEAQRVLSRLGFVCGVAGGSLMRQAGQIVVDTVRDSAREVLSEEGDYKFQRGFTSAAGIALRTLQAKLDDLRDQMKGPGLSQGDQAVYANLEELRIKIEAECDRFWHGTNVDWRPIKPVAKGRFRGTKELEA